MLTNYREDSTKRAIGKRSRGAIVNDFLKLPPGANTDQATREYLEELVSGGDAKLAGGFSMACGPVTGPLAVVSNRVSAADEIAWIAKEKGETVALSNTAFGDRSWPKIVNGEELMKEAVSASCKLGESEDQLVQRLVELLSTDTLPRREEGGNLETYIDLLRHSIFIPAIGNKDESKHEADEVSGSKVHEKADIVPNGADNQNMYMSGLYGTQTQTVVLVHKSGRVKYFERTLYDSDAEAIPIGKGDRVLEFMAGN